MDPGARTDKQRIVGALGRWIDRAPRLRDKDYPTAAEKQRAYLELHDQRERARLILGEVIRDAWRPDGLLAALARQALTYDPLTDSLVLTDGLPVGEDYLERVIQALASYQSTGNPGEP